MQAVGAIGKSGKAGEIDGSRREDDIAIALTNGDSLRAYTCFLSLLLLTSSLSSSALACVTLPVICTVCTFSVSPNA